MPRNGFASLCAPCNHPKGINGIIRYNEHLSSLSLRGERSEGGAQPTEGEGLFCNYWKISRGSWA